MIKSVNIFSSLFHNNQPVERDSESDDDIPQLSVHTLAALQEFYSEQKERDEVSVSQQKTLDIDEDWVCSVSVQLLKLDYSMRHVHTMTATQIT